MEDQTYEEKVKQAIKQFPEIKGKIPEEEGFRVNSDVKVISTDKYIAAVHSYLSPSERDNEWTNGELMMYFKNPFQKDRCESLKGHYDRHYSDWRACKLGLSHIKEDMIKAELMDSSGRVANRFHIDFARARLGEIALERDLEWVLSEIDRSQREIYSKRARDFMKAYPKEKFPSSCPWAIHAYDMMRRGEDRPIFEIFMEKMLDLKTVSAVNAYDPETKPHFFHHLCEYLTDYVATRPFFEEESLYSIGAKKSFVEHFDKIIKEMSSNAAKEHFKESKKKQKDMKHVMWAATHWTHNRGFDFKEWLKP